MPANIQVILQHDVDKLGKSGELVRVRPGFARNFLLPRQLAVPATDAAVRRIEHERVVAVAKAEKAKKEAREVAAKISGLSLKIVQKAGEDGRLFGSVTVKDVAAAIAAAGVEVDRKKVHLPAADKAGIKAVGEYSIEVKLASDVTATVKLEVVGK
jgi:large subunit ribosomal protein L9